MDRHKKAVEIFKGDFVLGKFAFMCKRFGNHLVHG